MLLLLLACTEPSPSDACTDASGLESGTISAQLDGNPWSSTATWLWQGESLQINAVPADGWSLTFVAQTTASGSTVKAAVDAASLPVDIALEDGAGGWVIAYPSDGDSLSSEAGGGTLSLTALEDDTLEACFSFEAASGATSLTAEEGALRAAPF